MTTENDGVKLYYLPGCGGCEKVEEASTQGLLSLEIGGEEADPSQIERVNLFSHEGVEALREKDFKTVPEAYNGSERCAIEFDQQSGQVTVKCPTGEDSEPQAGEAQEETPDDQPQ